MLANAALAPRSFVLLQSLTVAAALGAVLQPVIGSHGGDLSGAALLGQLMLATVAVAGGLTAIGSYRFVRRELSARTRGEAVARSQALTDELTGVLNRRGLRALAEDQLRGARRSGADVLVLHVDLIGLRRINDRFGHAEGDRALREVAALLQRTVRETDLVARVGGGEFTLSVLAGTPEAERAMRARLADAVAAYNGLPGQRFPVTLTVGAVHLDSQRDAELDELLRAADKSLYQRPRMPDLPFLLGGEWPAIPSAA